MVRVFRLRCATALLAGLAMLPIATPWACEIPDGAAISQFDADRMSGFHAARTSGLGEALRAENDGERNIVAGLFADGDTPVSGLTDGAYRCRTLKLGGLLPLVTYGWFDCAISEDGTVIEKLTGSQRFKGNLLAADGALFYWGALHYGDEQPFAYDADEERSQVGCLYQAEGEPLRYRLELPFPRFESTHDVIELVPAR